MTTSDAPDAPDAPDRPAAPGAELRRDLDGAVDAHRRLLQRVASIDDETVRRPSLLPGWTVGHVLAHLARNADSHVRMLVAGERGEVADQYAGGAAGREAEIERDAGAPAAALVADLRTATEALERCWEATTARGWAGEGRTVVGVVPLSDLPFRRWREAEVHHVDLGLGATHDDWPSTYVRLELQRMEMLWAARRPMGLTTLPPAALAARPAHRLAWLLGRSTIDGIDPAGVF
jgi:maleylpyruvate isomerase